MHKNHNNISEDLGTLVDIVCKAIKQRRLLSFPYKSINGNEGQREIRPYLLGVNKIGNIELVGVPSEEVETKTLNDRKSGHYLLKRIDPSYLKILDKTFDDPGVSRSRVVDTPTMKEIICRFRYDDESTTQTRY